MLMMQQASITDLLPKNRTGLDMILYCGRGMEDEPE